MLCGVIPAFSDVTYLKMAFSGEYGGLRGKWEALAHGLGFRYIEMFFSRGRFHTIMSRETNVQTIERTFDILEFLTKTGGSTCTEVAENLDVPVSTMHGYLRTLTDLNYLVRSGDEYRLSVQFLRLGEGRRYDMELFEVARSPVDELAETTGESALLVIEEHGVGVLLDISRGEDAVKVRTYPGVRSYLHSSAAGKAILAYLPDTRVEEIIETHGLESSTSETITDRETLEEELETIRERGYATDRNERIMGISCIAGPVLNETDEVLGAIGVCAPTTRIDTTTGYEDELADAVMDCINRVQVEIIYT